MDELDSRSADVEIRRVGPGDAAIFERVAADVFDDAIDPALVPDYLSAPGHHMVVAVREGEVVGQVAAVIHRHLDQPAELYIDNVGVSPAMWRRGIARRMLDEMFALGRELGCEEAWLGTEPDNVAARGLYESRGVTAEAMVMYVFPLRR